MEEGLDVMIPPLSIQPLVENAVKHGLMSRNEGGTVTLSILRREDQVEIQVKDDGVGMTAEQLQQILVESAPAVSQMSVGLRNIDRRLKQLFHAGLLLESAPGRGTAARFFVPAPDTAP